MAARMTATSREAVKAATNVELVNMSGLWAVKAWNRDRLCLVHGGDGFAMLYPSVGAAERAVLRINPRVVPSVVWRGPGAATADDLYTP